MRIVLATLAVFCAVFFPAVGQAQPAEPSCAELDGAKAEKLLEYLQGDRASLSEDCVYTATTKLGVAGYTPAIKTLVALLDYRTHGDPERARTGGVRQPGWPIYPAANALFLIGKPAEPEILKVLAKSDTSDLVRKVAIYALLNIESNEESGPVATLARASREEKDPGASQRLMDAAKEAATKCRPERQTVCINALNAK
jgi:HEAT repeat protein